jgi:hypothetical protein
MAAARGFDFLIRQQSPGGDFDAEVPVAVNALVGLSFLASGTTEDMGPAAHCAALRKCTDALLRHQDRNGYFSDGVSRMYGHGFATLFLAQVYGTGVRRPEIRSALKQALRVIEMSQSRDGGWDYTPRSATPAGEEIFGDTSITVCQTMALRAAQNLGIAVDETVVSRARRYIEVAQNKDGGFRYRPQLRRYAAVESAFPRSAAGVCILYSLGDYQSESIKKGFEYLDRNYRSRLTSYPYYGHYYCAQAMFQAGGRHWKAYFPWVRNHLLEAQRADGSWKPSREENRMQCTAMALIVLHVPYRYLPILER